MTKANEILINTCFSGAYITESDTNIGHEIINLVKDDFGRNFIYVAPSGRIDLAYHPLSSVLFVRKIEKQPAVEIISKAEGLSIPTEEEISSASYAGAPLKKIFADNIYRGEKQGDSQVFITFRAEKISFPTKNLRLILTLDPDFQFSDPTAKVIVLHTQKKSLTSRKDRIYFSDSPDSINFSPEAHRELSTLISDASLWKTKPEKLSNIGISGTSTPSFLKIIRKEYDEVIFSNLLAYYFEYSRPLFDRFCREILDIPDFGTNLHIVRERNKDIDLWIEGENHIIVIENKIKSNLNGIKSENYSQLNKYQEYTEARAKDPSDPCFGKKTSYFIFAPSYNEISIEKYKLEKPYKNITYTTLYDFFSKNASSYLSEPYFPDFLNGLKIHTMSISELNRSIMESRFLEKINQIS